MLKLEYVDKTKIRLAVMYAAKENFVDSQFKIFWDKDTLCICFKDYEKFIEPYYAKIQVFISLTKQFFNETKFCFETYTSDIWKTNETENFIESKKLKCRFI